MYCTLAGVACGSVEDVDVIPHDMASHAPGGTDHRFQCIEDTRVSSE